MSQCTSCGSTIRPLRADGECFRCHIRDIGFTFRGPLDGRHNWNLTTTRGYIADHVGLDNIRSGAAERVS